MLRALAIVLIGCNSSSPPSPSTATPSATTAQPAVATAPTAPPAVEILVAKADGADNLVVTDEYLYWMQGTAIVRAPRARGATSSVLFEDVLEGDTLMRSGDRLVWTAEMNFIFTAPLTGGTPTKIELADYPWSIADAGGLVVGSYVPGKRQSRVVRISETGEITELAKLAGETPEISIGVNGDIFVGTTTHSEEYNGVVGRIVDGKVVAIPGLRGATHLAADTDGFFCVTGERDSLVKVTPDAKAPVQIAKAQGGITAVAVDDRYVYWAESLGMVNGSLTGTLSRVAKAGGTPEPLPVEVGTITTLVVHGPDLYWSDLRKNVIARIRR